MLLLAVWLGVASIQRVIHQPPVAGGLVLATALVGVAVNLAAAWSMIKANRSSLNVEGAFQHILNDLFGFVASAIAGLVIVLTGFALRADIEALLDRHYQIEHTTLQVDHATDTGIGTLRDNATATTTDSHYVDPRCRLPADRRHQALASPAIVPRLCLPFQMAAAGRRPTRNADHAPRNRCKRCNRCNR